MFIKPCFELRFINPGGVTNGVKGGVENEQESFGRTAYRYFGSGYRGCRSRNSCYDFDCWVYELFGLHDYGNCCETVPAVGCRVGSRGNRGIHDSARLISTVGKGSFTPLLFLFSLGFINVFSVSFVGAS